MEQYAIIMAGGSGTRLWPLSRESRPKQFTSPDGGKCMLLQTIERVCRVVPAENCFIITNKKLKEITEKTVEGILPVSNIILEPMRKNTAACIAYASLVLKRKYNAGLICFVPADAYIKNNEAYGKAIEEGFQLAQKTKGLVVVGIKPTYPSTGYGYIQVGSENKVLRFMEKPDTKTAGRLVASGDYLWNGGILVGLADTIIESIRRFLPEHYRHLSEAEGLQIAEGPQITEGPLTPGGPQIPSDSQIERAYHKLIDISFDIGVLEKSDNIYAVKGTFDWDDIGSLDALSLTLQQDEAGNSVKGNHCGIDTENSVIYSDKALVATIGVENMIIVSTDDATIVCPRERAQEVKVLVEKLKQKGYEVHV